MAGDIGPVVSFYEWLSVLMACEPETANTVIAELA